MDKKSTIIGVILLCAAFYFMVNPVQQAANRNDEQRIQDSATVRQEIVEKSSKPASEGTIGSVFAPDDNIKEEILSLKSDTLNVHLTNRGGAIRDVELLKYRREQNSDAPYVFNEGDENTLAMALAVESETSKKPYTLIKNFTLVKSTDKSVIYKYVVPNYYEIEREFSLIDDEKALYSPYTIQVVTRIKNISKKPIDGKKIYLTLGSLPPTAGDIYGGNLAVGLYNGDDMTFAKSSLFVKSSGFLGLGGSNGVPDKRIDVPNAVWGTVKNQFFAAVFAPEGNKTAFTGFAEPVLINPHAEDKYMKNAIFGYMGFDMGRLDVGQTWELDGKYYVGPKDMTSLASMGARQDLVMDFGWFAFVSKPLALLMDLIHSIIEPIAGSWSWGWAIVILTLIVRAVLWPLTAAQIRSSQKMMKLAEPIKALKEKYKGDQQKIGQETMKLYSEYGVNPLAGCLPALIQIPVFIGLYYMLQTSSDIRFAHFLWIDDLALPDTISALPSIFGIPLHILPILNGFITFIQMSITPMPSTDKTQAVMFRMMPLVFLFFFYSFPSGLILYWCVQSSLGIVQALVVKHGSKKVNLVKKERKGPSFMEKLQMAAENAEKAKSEGGDNFKKMSFREKLAAMQKKAQEDRQKAMNDRLKGTMYEKRKKNPGGRSTKPKR